MNTIFVVTTPEHKFAKNASLDFAIESLKLNPSDQIKVYKILTDNPDKIYLTKSKEVIFEGENSSGVVFPESGFCKVSDINNLIN